MQIDWKYLATTPGYISLKATYVKAVQDAETHRRRFKSKPMRDKEEYLTHFNWIIGRAKHYAKHRACSLEAVLNEWEAKRDYCWLNNYQEGRQPKIHSNSTKRIGIKGIKKYNKKCHFSRDQQSRKNATSHELCRLQRHASTKSPKRWTSEYKKSRR